MDQKESLLRQIPNVDRILRNDILTGNDFYRHEIADAVRDVLAQLRMSLLNGHSQQNIGQIIPGDDELAESALTLAKLRARRGVCKVINGTGVMLHSNLGRACLSKAAVNAVCLAASSYSSLEYDLESGTRGSRTAYIEELLRTITGGEAALVVNNNAAAVLLALSSLTPGGNVIVSRGELVEIGGGFRIPEIIKQSGCVLREVGATNKTRISDYLSAIDDNTIALLKVHTSNFMITGFTQSVELKELAELGRARNIAVLEDIGSGALIDLRRYGVYDEPFVAESLEDGADVVTFSGDKLLGGPQCGIILGSQRFISAMKSHPLYRAFRSDKLTIAALEATLRAYSDPLAAARDIPVLSMLSLGCDALREKADQLCALISQRGGRAVAAKGSSVAGGGAAAGLKLDSYIVALLGDKSAAAYEKALRALPTPIIGCIRDDVFSLDVRTIFAEDFENIADAVAKETC